MTSWHGSVNGEIWITSNFPFDPRSMYGTDTFNGYAANFDETRSATPSSSYSYPYDDYQSSNYSGPGSEFDYLSASGYSTPYSGLDLFSDNVSEENSDWDPSLAAFFYSAEPSAFGSGAAQSFDSNGFTRSHDPGSVELIEHGGDSTGNLKSMVLRVPGMSKDLLEVTYPRAEELQSV
ncbi:hypothetical protein B0H16DRAFT_1470303 [Mycena metata]|uniref:Uncharacterized protein n=1 Tax=Mycena metata TaxID=1033252 RepID=A0AAD7MRM9_9AGAR|nr:hypothetical protein B0H16DRAFT_1470303 [Mycena metata]